ncbi:hypothetical protein Tco_0786601 [Tanacetum coccineum]
MRRGMGGVVAAFMELLSGSDGGSLEPGKYGGGGVKGRIGMGADVGGAVVVGWDGMLAVFFVGGISVSLELQPIAESVPKKNIRKRKRRSKESYLDVGSKQEDRKTIWGRAVVGLPIDLSVTTESKGQAKLRFKTAASKDVDKVDKWRTYALILTLVFFLSAGIWFIGIFLNSVDGYNEDSEHHVTTTKCSDILPLLANKANDTTEITLAIQQASPNQPVLLHLFMKNAVNCDMSSKTSSSWDMFAVRVQCFSSNPSPSLWLLFISPLMGCFGLSVLSGWRVIGAMGRWELVRVSWEGYLGGGMGVKPWERACLGFGGYGVTVQGGSQV